MARAEQDALVALWAAAPDDETFQARLEETGEYSAEEIGRLLTVRLPDDYGGFSLAAIRQLLPKLEEGLTTGEARKAVFPESFAATEPQDRLPPVLEALPELRNPAVTRTLTELRKAVNELVRRYGKPGVIQVELARDLKRNKKDRQALTEQNRDNEKKRDRARAELLQFGLTMPSRRDIEKYLLWEECGRMCPYSGRPISLHALYQEPQFDIEHIIPHSRSLDDSFQNKTLCLREYNHRKHNRTPWEAFGGNPEEWEPMIARVKKFGNKNKLKRFEMRETETAELLEQFSSNQLNDTRYMSKLAGKYLGLLYGGVSDATGTQRVFACAGGVTAVLRRMWGLDRILNPDAPGKSREDHRHHAVDAATVAVASRRMIQLLATAAGQAEAAGQRWVKSFEEPWPGFGGQLRSAILDSTTVSHKPERKLSGALHEETLYGRPKQDAAGKNWVHIRKPVHLLKEKDIDQIVDPTIRERVRLQVGLLGGDLKKLEREPATLETSDGRRIPIKKVRIRLVAQTRVIGQGARQRNVIPGDNHHMEVVAVQKKGKTAYMGHVVSRLEATRRHVAGEPVVRKEHGPDTEFLFTLSEADMVVWKGELWRVRSVDTNQQIFLSRASDARQKADIVKAGELAWPRVNPFCSTGGRKVRVTALGDIQECHD
jgi:CRISPR-associated endonuclease Csn1